MKTNTYRLPAAWASALINDDESGLSDDESTDLHGWLEANDPGYAIDCQDAGFCWRNDADDLGGDYIEVTFQVIES